jgi:hypothetical protein
MRECMYCNRLDSFRALVLQDIWAHVLRVWQQPPGLGHRLTLGRIAVMCRSPINNYFQHGNQTRIRSHNSYVVEVIFVQLQWMAYRYDDWWLHSEGRNKLFGARIYWCCSDVIKKITVLTILSRYNLSWPLYTVVFPTHTKWIRPY